jgi:hypothetical protein
MYHFPVDSTVNNYCERVFINKFENYQHIISIKNSLHFNGIKNKWQSYSKNDENSSSEYTKFEIKELIQRFEKKFDMSSDKFKELYAIGAIPDAFEIILWKSFLGLK